MAKRAYWCSTGGEPRSSGQSILAMRTLNAYVAEGEKKRRLVVAMVIVSPSYTLATRAYFMSGMYCWSLGAFCFLGCCVWSDFGSVGFASSSGCGGLVMVLTDGTVSKRDRASARLRLTDFHIMSYG